MFTSMLLSLFSDMFTSIFAILALIVIGAFFISLVLDLVFLLISPKSNGLYFKRAKKEKEARAKKERTKKQKEAEYEEVKEEVVHTPNNVTITPFEITENIFSFDDNDADFLKEVHSVDFEKAVHEQKLIQERQKFNLFDEETTVNVNSRKNNNFTDENLFTAQETNKAFMSKLDDFEEDIEESEEENILEIIKTVQEQAMKELSKAPKTEKIEETVVVTEKPEIKDIPTIRIIKPKLIYKTAPIEEVKEVKAKVKLVKEEVEEVKELVKEVIVEEPYNEFKEIREDIFKLKINSFKDLHKAKSNAVVSKKVEEEFEHEVIEKLKAIETLTLKEKEELLKVNSEVTTQNIELEKEVTTLEAEIATLKNSKVIEIPANSKAYYENRLEELLKEEAVVSKDLRKNKREFNPLKRIKRTLERDIVKLKRKEAIVAKQKLRIYGVNNTNDIDAEKLKKLDEEVAILAELKDSVYKCETILKQNKDIYPVLEKANNHLTRHLNSINKDIEEVKAQIAKFEEENK